MDVNELQKENLLKRNCLKLTQRRYFLRLLSVLLVGSFIVQYLFNQNRQSISNNTTGNEFHPFFSILIPAYNTEHYISDCFNSILLQSYQNFEIIVVDDCSTDNTRDILDAYSSIYTNIHVIHHKRNEGLLMARKSAVLSAKGKFCVFIDSDDAFSSLYTFSTLITVLENTHPDILEYPMRRTSSISIKAFKPRLHPFLQSLNTPEQILFSCYKEDKIPWNLCGKVIKTSICKNT